jgi:hypothetical protein
VSYLRPMSTGELLDRTFALYRKNFLLFVGIAAVTHLVYFFYEVATIRAAPFGRSPRITSAYYLNLAVALVFMTGVLTISQAATVKAVAAVHLGEPTSVWVSYKRLRGRVSSIFGVLILVFLIAGTTTAVLGIVAVTILGVVMVTVSRQRAAHSAAFNIMIGLSFAAAAFAIFVAVYVRYALAVQACVVENLGPWKSLKRSSALSKGGRWRIAAIYGLLVMLSWILGIFLSRLALLGATPWHSWIVSSILRDFAGLLSGSLTGPLATIGISLTYYDERVRKEAFDLQLMMQSLEPPVGTAVTATTV